MRILLVPGQGKIRSDLILKDSVYKKYWLSIAEEFLGQNLTDSSLKRHDAYSAAIIANSLAVFKEYCAQGGKINATAGYSVGQFGALAISGAISFEDAIKISIKRAQIMKKNIVPDCGMLSIFGFDYQNIVTILDDINFGFNSPLEKIYISNINSISNFTIGGKISTLERCRQRLKTLGCSSLRYIEVEGAWHTPYQEASLFDYEKLLDELIIHPPAIDFYCNVTGLITKNPTEIKQQLLKHLYSPVNWYQTIKNMLALDSPKFIECGSGDQLSKMLFFMRVQNIQKMNTTEEISLCAAL
jgi:[acyl-carrier-protein] S-malonyltransferase